MDSLHLITAHTPTDTRIFDKGANSLVEAGFDVGILAHDTPDEDRNTVQFVNLGAAETRPDRWKSIPRAARIMKELDAGMHKGKRRRPIQTRKSYAASDPYE